jgi:hypothetical protein
MNINQELNFDLNILMEQNYKYYLEYLNLLETNELLKIRLQNLIEEKNKLKKEIDKKGKKNNSINIINNNLNDNNNIINKEFYLKKKRFRRTKDKIILNFKCEKCNKKYSTESSLNHHYRLKHKKNIKKHNN